MTSIFSIILTVLTILKHESSQLELEIQSARDVNNKLLHDLSFLKSEWAFLASPKNIEKLSNTHLDYQNASLISLEDFLEIRNKLKSLK